MSPSANIRVENDLIMSKQSLAEYVDSLQEVGRYTFTTVEAQKVTELRRDALKQALSRLQAQKRIVAARRGFYVIVPLEHRVSGILPPDWFVDDLMKFLGQPYYVALLSAAELHGAAHQRPQVFQVMTSQPTRIVEAAGLRIRFFKKARVQVTPTEKKRTFTGDFFVSSPAATALDLVAYQSSMGGFDRVVTVLQELGENIEPNSLVEVAKIDGQLAHAQRLGWLLDKAGHEPLAQKLCEWLKQQKTKPTVLDPALPAKSYPRELKWGVIVNTEVEGEL